MCVCLRVGSLIRVPPFVPLKGSPVNEASVQASTKLRDTASVGSLNHRRLGGLGFRVWV